MVKLDINKNLFVMVIILVFLVCLLGFSYATWNSNKQVYHSADNVIVTINGLNYSLQEAISNNLLIPSSSPSNASGEFKPGTLVGYTYYKIMVV